MLGHRFFSSQTKASQRRQQKLRKYGQRNNLRLESLESRLALYAATLDLLPVSDSGSSNTDNITNATTWQIQVNDVADGATINLRQGTNIVSSGVASGTSITLTVDAATVAAFASGSVSLVAEDDANLGDFSSALNITKDQETQAFTSTAPTTGVAGTLLTYNAVNPEEGGGASYALLGGPSGAVIDPSTGVLTWTPTTAQIESFGFQIQFTDVAGNSVTQDVNLTIKPAAPGTPDLEAASDSGALATDNITNANSLSVTVSDVLNGATIKLFRDTTLIDTQVASGTSITFNVDVTALADGNYNFHAVQTVNGIDSADSANLAVTLDNVAGTITTTPPTTATAGVQLTYNAEHPNEGNANFVYALVGAPAGAQINAATGVLTWTPSAADFGVNAFQIQVTDAAGNTSTQSLSISVAPTAPATPDLQAASDSGASSTDNNTKTLALSIDVGSVIVGATVRLYRNGTLLNSQVAAATTVTFAVDMTGQADATYTFTSEQVIEGVVSPASAALSVLKDTTAPAAITSTAPTTATVGTLLTYDAAHAEEGGVNFVYSLLNAPAGATINATTGVLTWTPSVAQTGTQAFQIQVADPAGNTNTQSLSVVVANPSSLQNDLVAFAKALTAAGAIMYGADWCPHCNATKGLFDDGAKYLNFVEVTNPDRSPNSVATANNITSYPTWVFQNGQRLVGEQTLEAISAASGVAIPTGNTPSLAPLANVTLLHDSPLSIPLDGYDPNGGPLTYEITVSNPAILSGTQLSTSNHSIRIVVNNFGTITAYLYEDEVPDVTAKIIALINANKYDNTIFHRVISNFVIQGGDPNGNGQNDENQPEFDDQFDIDLQHNRSGVLSMAKTTDDTNTSQFFITSGPTRHLDFNHSIFGQVVEGDSVRAAIERGAVDANSKPINTVTIGDVQLFVDQENGMLRLKAANGVTSGSTNITVTVRDAQGNSAQQSFTATVAQDTNNTPPFLGPIQNLTTTQGTAVNLQLTSTDLQNNSVFYDIDPASLTGKPFTATVNNQTGLVTITPNATFVGTTSVTVRVRSTVPLALFTGFDEFDAQEVSITVNPGAPSGLDLVAGSDTGVSNTDNITKAGSWEILVSGVTAGATVQLKNGSTNIGSPVTVPTGATTVSITIADTSTFADGQVQLTAVQISNNITSNASLPLTITKDTVLPGAFTSTPPTSVIVGQAFNYNPANPDEGQAGFVYSLVNPPTGATINASTGQITWTPTAGQLGAQSFAIQFADPAGNIRSQNLNLTVISDQTQLVTFVVQVTDLLGDEITSIEQGEDFLVKVFVRDQRSTPEGIFSAYADLTYNQNLVTAVTPIQFGASFPNARSGSLSTAGLADEVGGTSSLTGLGGGEFEVFTIRFTASTIGTASFASNPADDATFHPVLLFNVGSAIPNSQITHASDTLNIVAPSGAVADEFTVGEDSTNNAINVLNNDTLPDGVTGPLTISAVTQPQTGGTVSIASGNGSLIFTPTPNFAGSTTFTYTVTNGSGFTDTATVTMTVTNSNDPPDAVNDTFSVNEDADNTTLNVLGNDSFLPDPTDTLTVTAVSTGSAGGTITIGANGANVVYKPAANFIGTETFTYTITDSGGLTDTATVTVTVNSVNDNPTAVADTLTVAEDADVTTVDVLANDSFAPDVGETLTVSSVTQGSKGGVVTITNNGANLSYKPAANANGTETFTYTISDGNGGTATATVTVTITAVNDNPTASDDTFTTVKNADTQTINVLTNDSANPDTGETLTITAVSTGSQSGTLAIINNGSAISYKPAANFSGTETFTYTISDGNGGTATATVTVTVQNFLPSDIAGFVFIDANKNGVRDAGEIGIAGVTVTLAGTDVSNNAVNTTAVSKPDGSYSFTNVAPGTYTLTETQPGLMVDGTESLGSFGGTKPLNDRFGFTIPENSHLTAYNFGEYGRASQFVSIRDFMTSTPTQHATSAITSGGASQWVTLTSGWTGVTAVSASLNTANTEVTLNITDSAGTQKTTTVPVSDTSKVQVMGISGTTRLIKLIGPMSAFTFTNVTSGQGEPPTDEPTSASSFAPTSSGNDTGSTAGSGDSVPETNDSGAGSELPDAQGEPVTNGSSASSGYNSAAALGASLALLNSSSNDSSSTDIASTVDAYAPLFSDSFATNVAAPLANSDSSVNFGADGAGSGLDKKTEGEEESTPEGKKSESDDTDPPADEAAQAVAIVDWEDDLAWIAEETVNSADESVDAEAQAVDAILADELWFVA